MPDNTYPAVVTNYSSANTATNSAVTRQEISSELALTIASAAIDRKGSDIALLRVSEVSYLADYFIIITGFSRVQVRALSQGIQDKVEKDLHRRPLRVAGQTEATWLLLDYGDAIAHILMPREREYYNLEAFWGHAERIELSQILAPRSGETSPY